MSVQLYYVTIYEETPDWKVCSTFIDPEIEYDIWEVYNSALKNINKIISDKYIIDMNISGITERNDLNNPVNKITQLAMDKITKKSLATLHSDKIDMKVLSELDSDVDFQGGEEIILVTTRRSNESDNFLLKVILGTCEHRKRNNWHIACYTKSGDVYSDVDCILIVKRETYEDFGGKLNI